MRVKIPLYVSSDKSTIQTHRAVVDVAAGLLGITVSSISKFNL